MIRIGICDDEQKELETLETAVRAYCSARAVDSLIHTFSSGDEIIAAMKSGFDIVFLDIYMGLDDGIAVAKKIRELDKACVIIFATTSTNHAIRGYGVHALRYLVKPVGPTQLNEAMDEATEELASRSEKSVQISNKKGSWKIMLDELQFAESNARVITVHTRRQGEILYYGKLDDLEKRCADERFFRCHKSFLVNLDFVQAIVEDRIVLDAQAEIPISKNVQKAREAFASRVAGLRF